VNADEAYGIDSLNSAAETEISGNNVHVATSVGIFAIGNHNSILIEDNIIVPGPGSVNGGNGILVDGFHDADYRVTHNTVVCENPFADGIIAAGVYFDGTVGAIIDKNHVIMHNSQFGGMSLYGLVSSGYIGENKIEGDGAFALQVFGFEPQTTASSIRLQGNDISHFTSSVADVFFSVDTQDNVLLGHCSSLIDLGVNNRVTRHAWQSYERGNKGTRMRAKWRNFKGSWR